MQQTNIYLPTAMASYNHYEAMVVRRYLLVYFCWKKNTQAVLVNVLKYKEQNFIIYFLVMQETDKVFLTAMALYDWYEAMQVSRHQLVFICLENSLFSFTQCI